MAYSALLLEHFHHPRYVGALEPGVGVYHSEASVAGADRVKLAIATEGDQIRDIRYQVYGCPAMIACMSWLASEVIHKDYATAKEYKAPLISAGISLPAHKYRCALLAEQVLEKALEEWYNKPNSLT